MAQSLLSSGMRSGKPVLAPLRGRRDPKSEATGTE